MNVLGIIAEFNPFHNGHLHLIDAAKNDHNFAAVVCVMSGNFMQRAEPAICGKWSRAEMALDSGVDLVIELPFGFAVRSAYYFARGAVQLLARTGVVTHLGFGSEAGRLDDLQKIAALLADEPDDYKLQLKKYLARGLSYPAARSKALQDFMGLKIINAETLLNGPNNILAIEYLRNIKQGDIKLTPFTIPRKGQHYHSHNISHLTSAKAIRSKLYDNPVITPDIAQALPPTSQRILLREIIAGRAPVLADSLEQAILTNLRGKTISSLRQIFEVSEGLEYRIKEAANSSGSLEQLRRGIKSKRYSLSRVNRILLYTFFNLSPEQMTVFDQHGPLYFHILAVSSKGREILLEMKNKSSLPILSRGSEVKKMSQIKEENAAADMLALDIRATDIYSLLLPSPEMRQGSQDFLTSPVTENRIR